MKKLTVLLALHALAIITYGQSPADSTLKFTNKNSVQFELFGHGMLYSLNYERILLNGEKFKTTGQVGFSYYPPSTDILDFWFPISINELISFNQHHLEIGAGCAFIYNAFRDANDAVVFWQWDNYIVGRIGYRYQKPDGRILWRVGFTPFYEPPNHEIHPSGGLSVGYSF